MGYRRKVCELTMCITVTKRPTMPAAIAALSGEGRLADPNPPANIGTPDGSP